MSSTHSRNGSDDTTATSMSYILEHVLQYPASYEIPLRTMYTLNCVPRAQPLPKDLSRAPTPTSSSGDSSPVDGSLAWTGAESASVSFTSQLMTHLNSLPTQPSSLPPTFIVNFVGRCFHASLALVDFPQALTSLDYLRDLENRRRREMVAAFERVHIHADTYESDIENMAERFPGIALWVRNVEGKNKKAEGYYAQLYLGLRRWIMINELSIQPFNKLNCVGMLNTLLPPMQSSAKLQSPMLSHEMLKDERDAFFDYIREVQKKGPSVLEQVVNLHKAGDEETGWPAVQRSVDKYLRVAKNMIDDCLATTGPESFRGYAEEPRKGKKTDSGVSFGSERRPSVNSSLHETPMPEPPTIYAPAPKGLSTIERITREFKRMRVKPRPEVDEIIQINQDTTADHQPQSSDNKVKALKKARSLASLRLRGNGSSVSLVSRKGSDVAAFNPKEMKKHRQMYDASINKSG
ncbi:hypothetical protein P153DRAFT_372155 [Dothidotthia symphoricarpi CBS 119687]|uniref:Uncharacterized protein n=1 Tax=Dothidotthia symphoricarpi CBS 119687 TaxID=1392245 RepID=A0A6A6AT89_9PLEO|nr:uncharacterized protein P153DRAFT_372155 [Dothidotthia symphoricarpi CBS 119687]KAF2134880.1 hypothetical protein P153DRAFT_372155 [Dothidotthia symphoricarpi CBS 119687]